MASDYSTTLKNSTTEELRLRNYRDQLQAKNDLEMTEVQARHDEDLQRRIENHANQMDDLRRDYDVQISQEAEQLEERLHQVRMNAEERVNSEKKLADDELNKIRVAGQKRIEEYKKNSEAQLSQVRRELQASTDALHEKARKSAQAVNERERSGRGQA